LREDFHYPWIGFVQGKVTRRGSWPANRGLQIAQDVVQGSERCTGQLLSFELNVDLPSFSQGQFER